MSLFRKTSVLKQQSPVSPVIKPLTPFDHHEEERKRLLTQWNQNKDLHEEQEEMERVIFEQTIKKAQNVIIDDYPEIFYFGHDKEHYESLTLRDEDILMDGKLIKEASIDKLVEYATQPFLTDGNFVDEFQLVFRAFVTPKELFLKLLARYNTLPSVEHFCKDAFIKWKNEFLAVVRIRSVVFVKRWIERHWSDFDQEVIPLLDMFLDIVKQTEPRLVEQIVKAREVAQNFEKKLIVDTSKFPKPIIPEDRTQILYSWDPIEVARQLTLFEFEIFSRISPYEFMNQRWVKKDKEIESPNITLLIQWFNNLNIFLISFILTEFDVPKRAERLKWVVRLGEELKKVRNYNGLFEITSVLCHQSIHRLKKTWDACGQNFIKNFEENLQSVSSPEGNFKGLREIITPTSSCIPYVGIFFTDMIMIDEGNKSWNGSLVNYSKCRKSAKVLSTIISYQHTPFEFEVLPQLRLLLMEINQTKDVEDKDLYEMSCSLEGRGGKTSFVGSKNITIIKPSEDHKRPGSMRTSMNDFSGIKSLNFSGSPISNSTSGKELKRLSQTLGTFVETEDEAEGSPTLVKKIHNQTTQDIAWNLIRNDFTDEMIADVLSIPLDDAKRYRMALEKKIETSSGAAIKLFKYDWTNDKIAQVVGLAPEDIASLREKKPSTPRIFKNDSFVLNQSPYLPRNTSGGSLLTTLLQNPLTSPRIEGSTTPRNIRATSFPREEM